MQNAPMNRVSTSQLADIGSSCMHVPVDPETITKLTESRAKKAFCIGMHLAERAPFSLDSLAGRVFENDTTSLIRSFGLVSRTRSGTRPPSHIRSWTK